MTAAAPDIEMARADLARTLAPFRLKQGEWYAAECEMVKAYGRLMEEQYAPPLDKHMLVILQDSTRRPYSNSPVHGPLRGAVTLATGYDPRFRRDFAQCPVHVVVLDSVAGMVPYEFEDLEPAVLGRGGVKTFGDAYYLHAKQRLASQMAGYLTSHRTHYQHVAAFAQGRYGEVTREARSLAGMRFPVFPVVPGLAVTEPGKLGTVPPRTYFRKCWIQLFFEIIDWLEPAERQKALARLKAAKVQYCRVTRLGGWGGAGRDVDGAAE